jgi:hypothetical protein
VIRSAGTIKDGPGRTASARSLLAAIFLVFASFAAPAAAQPAPAPATITPIAPARPTAPMATLPDGVYLAKLLWSTMAAIDHANRTGNYSVLRELGSVDFKTSNNVAALAAIFAGVRNQHIDLSDTLLFEPVYEFPPRIEGGMLRMRGAFRMRPTGVEFDLLYDYNNGWRLHAVAIRTIATTR